MELKAGEKAPAFSLPDENGRMRKLSDYKGKTIVLYFYPRDDTPGCTMEACGFRDTVEEIRKKGAVVIGVSADDAKSHQKFISKYKLNFTLLSDVDKEVCKSYGVWREKSFMGKKFMGIVRSTFVIDGKGKITYAKYGVNPLGHAKGIMAVLEGN